MVKKESKRTAKKKEKREFEERKDLLSGAIKDLSESLTVSMGVDVFEEYMEKWMNEAGFDKMAIKGHRRIHDGTTFSLDAITSMTDTLQLWLLCRIYKRWTETGMSKRTAPLDLTLNVSVDFEGEQ